MNRRRFLALLAVGAPATVVAEKLGLLERARSYFFAPRGGWPDPYVRDPLRHLWVPRRGGHTEYLCQWAVVKARDGNRVLIHSFNNQIGIFNRIAELGGCPRIVESGVAVDPGFPLENPYLSVDLKARLSA
jgi:hypothetical protein